MLVESAHAAGVDGETLKASQNYLNECHSIVSKARFMNAERSKNVLAKSLSPPVQSDLVNQHVRLVDGDEVEVPEFTVDVAAHRTDVRSHKWRLMPPRQIEHG